MRRTLAGLLAVLLLGFGACSSNSEGSGGEEVQDLGGTSDSLETSQETSSACKLKVSLKGKAYKITRLEVKEPAGKNNGLADALTKLWNKDIEDGRLVILFYVKEHDLQSGHIVLEVGTGILDKDGKYGFIEDPGPSPLEAHIDGCNFTTTLKGKLVLYPNTVTSYIPIVAMDGYGEFDERGTKIENGKLSGAICVDAAEKIWFQPIPSDFDPNNPPTCSNFEEFMKALHIEHNRNDLKDVCDTGNPEGYNFKGLFSAEEIKNFKRDLIDFDHNFTCKNLPKE